MPPDACQRFFDCPGCHALLRPKPGGCRAFCSRGIAPCPAGAGRRQLPRLTGFPPVSLKCKAIRQLAESLC
ncbi:GDCCVxC domain-containing (seleno)protein [Leisingera thetidis]|uniref:GDCCVxC domain-containing (seleno)protein n=1 Tax=Leisingera thetidis TaxID=2930199 RepID=UPI0033142751